jgi:voltage-gated potassium channel
MTEQALTPVEQIGDFPFAGESRQAWEAFRRWKARLLDFAADNPTEALFVVVTGGALAFYLAEKDHNEKVGSYSDALHYASTCLSVGYANLFPVTELGKLVATIIMTIGPSLAAWVIEGRVVARERSAAQALSGSPPLPAAPAGPDFAPLLGRLDAILEEMRAARTAPPSEAAGGSSA